MIEVEQKFQLKPGDRERLLEGAKFVSKKVITDVYYDTPEMVLIGRETFLRERDGHFELKVPLHTLTKILPKAYHFNEMADEAEIRKRLNLSGQGSIRDALEKAGYIEVARIKNTRTEYRRGEFTLDFDETDFGFSLVEIERTSETEEGRDKAAESILSFAKQIGLENKHVRGKIHEYLRLKRPDLWEKVKAEWMKWPAK